MFAKFAVFNIKNIFGFLEEFLSRVKEMFAFEPINSTSALAALADVTY